MYWPSQRGIFTRPMSSPMGWCEHASAMRMRSPGFKLSMASAPRANCSRSPFCRANKMEKEVMGTSGGVSAATLRKACESVTTRAGLRCMRASASRNSRSLTTMA